MIPQTEMDETFAFLE